MGSCDAAPALESSMGSLIRVVIDTVGESEDHQDGIKRIADLPAEILDIIFARVGFRNIMRSSITCKRWYSLVISKTGCETPWLMLHDKSLDEHQFALRFVSLWGDQQDSKCRALLDLPPRLAFELSCVTSTADGWLLFGSLYPSNVLIPNSLWLHNPFRKVRVRLPRYSPEDQPNPFPWYSPEVPSNLSKDSPPQCLVFYSSQLSCDFVVLISGKYISLCKLYGKKWLHHHDSRFLSQYEHILFWSEKQFLCAIAANNHRGQLSCSVVVNVFRLVDFGGGEFGLALVKSVQLGLGVNISIRRGLHLVESLGDVLIVIFLNDVDKESVVVNKFSLNETEGPKRMKSLGGQTLFLGVKCPAFSVAAKDFPQVKENSIYFASHSDVSVFSPRDDGAVTKTVYDPKYGFKCPEKFRTVRLIKPWGRKISGTTRTLSMNQMRFSQPHH